MMRRHSISFSQFAVLAMLSFSAARAQTSAPATTLPDRIQVIRDAEAKLKPPRPDLKNHHSELLDAALKDPESLWKLLTGPETPYKDRMAASLHAGSLLPVEYFDRVFRARVELKRESRLHRWGLEQHPLDNAVYPEWAEPRPRSWLKTPRSVLGSSWQPGSQQSMPLTFEEESTAPWPWQVQRALQEIAWPDDVLLSACSTLRVCDDEEAWLLFESTLKLENQRGDAMLPIIARWRSIATGRSFPFAAPWVASRAPGDADAAMPGSGIGEILAHDIIVYSPHQDARCNAMGYLFATQSMKFATVLQAAAYETFSNRSRMTESEFLSCLHSICGGTPIPLISTAEMSDIRAGTPEARNAGERFEKWYYKNQGELFLRANARKRELKGVREALDKVTAN